jgi:hypothetical protein
MDIDQLCRVVRNPADLHNLPGYAERINPALVRLKRVIWPYSFRSEIPCALTNCRTPHKAGVIVELEGGTISNIGNVCGSDEDKFSTKFSIEMLNMATSRRREAMMPLLLDRVALQEIERQVHAAYHLGEKWLRRRVAFSAMCPEAGHEVARRRASGSTMVVVEVVERSAGEINDMVATGQARNRSEARYKEVERGVIRGSGMVELSESAISSLWRRADALLAANPMDVDISGLQRLFTEANHLPQQARGIVKACEAAEAFFTPANFALMTLLPMESKAKEALGNLTVEKLDAYAVVSSGHRAGSDGGAEKPLSKKRRDLLKRTEAIQRAASRIGK